MSQWLVADVPGGVHILPPDDLAPHTQSEGCFCAPEVSLVDGPSHVVPSSTVPGKLDLKQYVRKLITHKAFDGRE